MSERKICGAKTVRGQPCKAPPMANGRCRVHGGATPKGVDSPQFIHGRYSQYLPQVIADKAAAFENDNPLDLLPELAMQRALLAQFAERYKDGVPLGAVEISYLMEWVTEITRTGERINKMRLDTALTGAEIKFLAARIADVVAKYVPDPDTQRAFIAELFSTTTSPEYTDASNARRLASATGSR